MEKEIKPLTFIQQVVRVGSQDFRQGRAVGRALLFLEGSQRVLDSLWRVECTRDHGTATVWEIESPPAACSKIEQSVGGGSHLPHSSFSAGARTLFQAREEIGTR